MSGRGGPVRMAGPPGAKAVTFGPSARRLLSRMGPDAAGLAVVSVLALASVALTVLVPRLLGDATDLVVRAALGGGPLDRSGLARTIAEVAAVCVLSAGLSFLQGLLLNRVVQRTVFRLRGDVEAKLHRLPLSHVDSTPRGDLLSRVTNDIDNISQSLQQTVSQALVSALTVVGVVVMMFTISWRLALVALVAIPLTLVVVATIAKRSQPLFVGQWRETGALNAQIEEAFTGHDVVTAFGRREEVRARFAAKNAELYAASAGAQFLSGTIMPSTMLIGNLVYVAIAVVGATMVTGGSITIGGVQAFVQYSRQFTQPLAQLGSMANLLQSGVASAERVFDVLDAPELSPDPVDGPKPSGPGRVEFEHVSFRYTPTPRSSRTCRSWPRRAARSRSSGRPGRARRRW